MLKISLACTALLLLFACSVTPKPIETKEHYEVLFGGIDVGDLKVIHKGNDITVDFGFSNNGRGASSAETLVLSNTGLPLNWQITGKTTFGNAVNEQFVVKGGTASWIAAAGKGSLSFDGNSVYVAQSASPYSYYLYAKALLNASQQRLSALPAGELAIQKLQSISLTGSQTIQADIFAITGIELDPSYIALDAEQNLLAYISPRVTTIRQDLIENDAKLRELAADMNASRFEKIASKVSHKYEQAVRINNIKIFNPETLSLSTTQSVLINGNRISAIEAVVTTPKNGEILIEGKGGTLIPGLYEMHGHMSDNDALLNVMAGVTSVRDMGNEIDVLDPLIDKIRSGILIGPRITKSAFIEGKSKFSAATGEMASSEQEAVDLVNMYADRGDYSQIKIYSSIDGNWVPAMAAAAKKRGMRVAGHIPAFSNVDEMMAAGYDEITHINQVMLSWVLDREEDTRTLFRITGMKRFADVDLNSERVKKTLSTMVENNVAVDPTIVIHEFGLTARNGETRKGMQDYIANMPIGVQRNAKVALLNVKDDDEDRAYLFAYEKVLDTLTMMHKKGIFLVPGTDLGGAFELHRELELFTQIGMSNAEALRRGSYDMANYLGYGKDLGSIEQGKLADFFLVPGNPITDITAIKTISMVAKDGVIYFPSEVYPEFGIIPFTEIPEITISIK